MILSFSEENILRTSKVNNEIAKTIDQCNINLLKEKEKIYNFKFTSQDVSVEPISIIKPPINNFGEKSVKQNEQNKEKKSPKLNHILKEKIKNHFLNSKFIIEAEKSLMS